MATLYSRAVSAVRTLLGVPIKAAEYDGARSHPQNERHWAIGLQSADPDPAKRAILRNRSRYEYANNAFLAGMVETYSRDVVGSGPRPTFASITDPTERSSIVAEWQSWLEDNAIVDLLHTLLKTYLIDGECFLLSFDEAPYFRIIESERIRFDGYEDGVFEGIRYRDGQPVAYCVDGKDWFNADVMTHHYRQDFANQRRGVPRAAPSLELFALARRLTLAVVTANETAANIAMVLHAKGLPPSQQAKPFEVINLVRGSALTLPDGYELGQVTAEHPNSTHRETITTILGEAARAFPMPLNKALGTSQDSNFASGSLDNIDYERAILRERTPLQRVVSRLRAIFWDIRGGVDVPCRSYWDAIPHLNPEKNLSAVEKLIALGLSSRTREAAKFGADYAEIMAEQNREQGDSNNVANNQQPPSDQQPPTN